MEQKRGRGRPKGSTKKSKVSPLVEEKEKFIEDLGAVVIATSPMPEILKPLAKEVGFPEGWEKMSKVEKLKFLTAKRR